MKNRSVTKHIPKDYLNTGLAAVFTQHAIWGGI